jgi:hypothetical protein
LIGTELENSSQQVKSPIIIWFKDVESKVVSSRSGVLLLSRPTSKVFLSPYGRVFLNSKQGVEPAGLHRILEINEDSPACGTSHKRHALSSRINVLVRFKSAVRVRHLSGVFHRIARRNVSNNLFRKNPKRQSATISASTCATYVLASFLP